MTPEEQRIAIARELDFYLIEPDEGGAYSLRHGRETTMYPWHATEAEAWEDSPDFLNDLNAIHEVEKSFPAVFRDELANALPPICERDYILEKHWSRWPQFAGASQRAEAFLRTLGKWKDSSTKGGDEPCDLNPSQKEDCSHTEKAVNVHSASAIASNAPSTSDPATGRDWTEDFPHENGSYRNQCVKCCNFFTGHKRRVVCRLCAQPEKGAES